MTASLAVTAPAQDDQMDHHDHSSMAGHHHHMGSNQAGELLMEQASGTSMNPKAAAMPRIGTKTGSWNWMFMGAAFLVETQQSGPRGGALLERTAGVSFRIGAYTLGYTRDVELIRFAETGIGANFTAYTLPSAIQPYYGNRPFGVNIYVRFRLRPGG
jgi:hypothetical protein